MTLTRQLADAARTSISLGEPAIVTISEHHDHSTKITFSYPLTPFAKQGNIADGNSLAALSGHVARTLGRGCGTFWVGFDQSGTRIEFWAILS